MALLLAHYGLPVVALIIFAGEIGVPTLVPGEVGLLFAGNQYVESITGLLIAIAVFGAIDLLATSTIHGLSRTSGNILLRKVLKRVWARKGSPEELVQAFRSKLGGRDSLVVFCTRLIPMFRLYASIATGLVRVELRRFLMGAAPAAWIWASIPLTVGFVLRARVGTVASQYGTISRFVIPASIVLTIGFGLFMWLKHQPVPAAGRAVKR